MKKFLTLLMLFALYPAISFGLAPKSTICGNEVNPVTEERYQAILQKSQSANPKLRDQGFNEMYELILLEGPMLKFIQKRYKDPEHKEYDDVMQMTLIAMLKKFPKGELKTYAHFKHYVHITFRSRMADILKKNYVKNSNGKYVKRDAGNFDDLVKYRGDNEAVKPDEIYSNKEAREKLMELISDIELSEKEKIFFYHRFILDRTLKEASAEVGYTHAWGTVTTQRIMAKLENKLGHKIILEEK